MAAPQSESKDRKGTRPRSMPKQRDAERTKKRLLDAAEVIFAKNGLEGASTEAIARRAGVSKTMLFYYFQNKEQLYLNVLRRLFEAVVDPARAAEIEAMEPHPALQAIVEEYFNIHISRPTFAELTLREAMTYGGKYLQQLRYELPFVGQLMRVLRRGALDGTFRSVDPLKTTLSMIGMTKILFTYREAMERILEQELLSGEAIVEWRDHIVDLLMNGVAQCNPNTAKAQPPPSRAIPKDLFGSPGPQTPAG
jgi:TetR/AcrR family transcriptional regulator